MSQEQQALATRDRFDVPDKALAERKFQAIKAFQALVQSQMVKDLDFGTIPGTPRPTLLKPGAEKIAKLMGLADTYEILAEVKNWDKPFFEFLVRCTLNDGEGVVSQGLGECNSMEAKYRWRLAKRKCPRCHQETIFKSKQAKGGWYCYGKVGGCGANFIAGDAAIENQTTGRVPNEDIFDQVNTLLKMARKRALVDAALSAGRLSDIFTQDMEDIQSSDAEGGGRFVDEETPAAKSPSSAGPQTESTAKPPEAPQDTGYGPVPHDYTDFWQNPVIKEMGKDKVRSIIGMGLSVEEAWAAVMRAKKGQEQKDV